MIIFFKFTILAILIIGIVTGHVMMETGAETFDYDKIWQGYSDEESIIPEPIVKGIIFGAAKIAYLGHMIAESVYPYGLHLAVVLFVLAIIDFTWILYPILFVYVLRDERKRKQKCL